MNKPVRFVVFTQNTALILTNPDNWEELFNYPNVIPEPDLSSVFKIQPHFWKQVGNQVVEMNEEEKKYRLEHIAEHGIITDIEPIDEFVYTRPKPQNIIQEKIVEIHNVYENKHLKIALYAVVVVLVFVQLVNIFKK